MQQWVDWEAVLGGGDPDVVWPIISSAGYETARHEVEVGVLAVEEKMGETAHLLLQGHK